MSVGEDLADEIFKHLNSREVKKLSVAISNLAHISNHQLTNILSEFEENATKYAAINLNTRDYLNSVLVKALHEEHANSLLEDIFETKETVTGIDKLNFMAPEMAVEMIRDEHPQIIAATLVH
ncbi:Flagellar motor switch protein FliG [Arsenophonus endosymbiont of Bemisia tabaci Q2]|nr:Flagellar motor switch protein FliG [Arsenophonus endosymbiont of Bemisia tabaci Q2]